MTPEQEIVQLKKQLNELQYRFDSFQRSALYDFQKDIQIADGRKIIVGTTNGTKIGNNAASFIDGSSGATSKLGFFGQTPAVRWAVGGPSTIGATWTSTEQNTLQAVWDALRSYGLIRYDA